MSTVHGMNPVHLVLALAEALPEPVAHFELGTGKGTATGPVLIHTGIMPTKRSTQADAPFLYVYLMDGADHTAQGWATVGILVGTYSEEQAGWMDALNLAMAVRTYLLESRVIDGKYRLLLDEPHGLKYTTYEQLTAEARTFPFNYVHLTTTWQMATIVPSMPDIFSEV